MIKILIADDHAMMREGLRRIVNDTENMTIVGEASDGSEVLDMLGALDADLLLMDMSMPGMSGIDLVRHVRSIKPSIPILIMTMYDTGMIAVSALKAGANGYITKNTNPEHFPIIISKIASGERYIDPLIANNIIFEGNNDPMPPVQLSQRETQILKMLVSGMPIKTIASELFISPKTVTTHKKRLMEKLGIKTNADLVRYTLKHQLDKTP